VSRTTWAAAVTAGVLSALASAPRASAEGSRSYDVRSVFFVAKSENKNQVHYGIHLDRACAPAGDRPVFAYWQMLEHGPDAIEPVLPVELQAYGVADQRVLARSPAGGSVRIALAALRERPVVVETRPDGSGGCTATATTTVEGVPASLWSVYIRLRWPFGVESLTLTARATGDGRIVQERLRP